MKKNANLTKKKLVLGREVVKQLREIDPEHLQDAVGRAPYSATDPCASAGQWTCPN